MSQPPQAWSVPHRQFNESHDFSVAGFTGYVAGTFSLCRTTMEAAADPGRHMKKR
jgi:hypothetical protein